MSGQTTTTDEQNPVDELGTREGLKAAAPVAEDGCVNELTNRPLLEVAHSLQTEIVSIVARKIIDGAASWGRFGEIGSGDPDITGTPGRRARYSALSLQGTRAILLSTARIIKEAVSETGIPIGAGILPPEDESDLLDWIRAGIAFAVGTADIAHRLSLTCVDYGRNGNSPVEYNQRKSFSGLQELVDVLSNLGFGLEDLHNNDNTTNGKEPNE